MVMLGVSVSPKRRGMVGLCHDLRSHYRDYRLAVEDKVATRHLQAAHATVFAAEAGKVVTHQQAYAFYKAISSWIR